MTIPQILDKLATKMRKRAQEEATRPVPRVYDDVVQEIVSDPGMQRVAAKLPDFQSMKSSMYRKCRARLPPLPKSRAEVNLQGEWAETTSGEPFVIGTRGDDKIILLRTTANLKLLEAADSIYMDGTFKTCPQLFYQMFTIHAFYHAPPTISPDLHASP